LARASAQLKSLPPVVSREGGSEMADDLEVDRESVDVVSDQGPLLETSGVLSALLARAEGIGLTRWLVEGCSCPSTDKVAAFWLIDDRSLLGGGLSERSG